MADIIKQGGFRSSFIASSVEVERQVGVDPDDWLETLFRAMKNYVFTKMDSDIYDIIFSFPTAVDLHQMMPLPKTVIHFEIDDIKHPVIGFGDNIMDLQLDDVTQTVVQYEANQHVVNWDVGVWASDRSGGVTARLKAFKILADLFVGPQAYRNLQDIIGVELMNFAGGTFLKEEIDDLNVFRVSSMTLVTRVYSRKIWEPEPYIGGFQQQSELEIDGEVIVDV